MLNFQAIKTIFTRTQTQDSSPEFGLCSCNLLAETNNSDLGAILLSCLVSELQKPSLPGLEPGTVLLGCGLCPCYLLTKTNNFGLGVILLSCKNNLHQESNPGQFFRFVAFVSVISFSKQTPLVLTPFSYCA
jgi:hypothetical protein